MKKIIYYIAFLLLLLLINLIPKSGGALVDLTLESERIENGI